MAFAGMEAQRVIGLRMMKLVQGGPGAPREVQRMVAEKISASAETVALASGRSPAAVVRRTRTIIRANKMRLSKSR